MLSRTLIKTAQLDIDGRSYRIDYYEGRTSRGRMRCSGELVVGPDDRIILDGNSLGDVEWRMARLMPATIRSRVLAGMAA